MRARRIVFPVAAFVIALMAGCSVNTNFVYKPNPPASDGRKLPVMAAVLPFEDGTENFTERGSIIGGGQYNLAKVGFAYMNALPPEFWGKAFADELTASDSFRSARFVYSPSEIRDEGLLVDGTLKKVIYTTTWESRNEIFVSFKATRTFDRKVVWEKEVGKAWQTPTTVYDGCRKRAQCMADRKHDDWNKWVGSLLAEARADLVRTLASLPESSAGEGSGAKPAGQPAPPESVDQTIDKILKDKWLFVKMSG